MRNSLKENLEIISEKNELNFSKSKKTLKATEAEKKIRLGKRKLLGFVFALHLHLIFFYKIIYSILQSVKKSFLLPSLIFLSASAAFRFSFDFEKFHLFLSLIIFTFPFKESLDLVAFSFQILHHLPLLCKNPNRYT